ncbi:MAG: hypothetical protein COB67_00235 [SAR324 cluster bacterium]|uniref:Uncharacterized protein n=1 Tax=SAR324 cluster bacterium TaxID=2024889 RepID=A0A2A4TD84_9DELT|nr:MAG: hypothetical protein COB67_00235 [SAR324 cluster bacterium]
MSDVLKKKERLIQVLIEEKAEKPLQFTFTEDEKNALSRNAKKARCSMTKLGKAAMREYGLFE